MEELDVLLQSHLKTYVIPLIILIVIAILGKSYIRRIQSVCYAYFVTKLAKSLEKSRKMNSEKHHLFAELHKLAQKSNTMKILEVGAGSGANFGFYPDNSIVICIEPNPDFDAYQQESAAGNPHVQCEWVQGHAEDLSAVPDDSVDAVVATHVFCSIPQPQAGMAISEIKRILKPGCKFYYVEHVCADRNTFLYRFQHFIDPFWKLISGGCSLTRKPWKLLDTAGFTDVDYKHTTFKNFPYPLKPHLIGTATK